MTRSGHASSTESIGACCPTASLASLTAFRDLLVNLTAMAAEEPVSLALGQGAGSKRISAGPS